MVVNGHVEVLWQLFLAVSMVLWLLVIDIAAGRRCDAVGGVT